MLHPYKGEANVAPAIQLRVDANLHLLHAMNNGTVVQVSMLKNAGLRKESGCTFGSIRGVSA